jgi:AraC family transcriptional regulator, regulatory protein of adaptative response / methylated-DNA-[protein]-cysteine methyltransferase
MSADYRRVEKAIDYLDRHRRRQPELPEIASAVGLSPYHFQRLFRRWAGVSPKRFLQFLTAGHARALLLASVPVLEAAAETGLSGPGRLHDLMVSADGATPGEVGSRGEGLTIRYGTHETPFGACFIAITGRGICAMRFVNGPDQEGAHAADDLRRAWRSAVVGEDVEATGQMVQRVFGNARGGAPPPLDVRGTNFQLRVWEALLRIPEGSVTTYERIARAIGAPRAVRAVGSAIASNPVAYLIPCHRVVRKTGAFGEYRWGPTRKRAIIAWEGVRAGR